MQNENAEVKDFALPEQGNELSQAEEVIEKLKVRLKTLIKDKSITDESHVELYEDAIKVLDFVGKLSLPAFALEDEMEEYYVKTYIHAPQLAKTLWLNHYERIHHPYNILKNRCFRILEEVDAEYFKTYKKRPPNWKP